MFNLHKIKELIIKLLKKLLPRTAKNQLIRPKITNKKALIKASLKNHWFESANCKNLNELPWDKIERLYFEGLCGCNKNLVDVPFSGRMEKCRYCGITVIAALHADHIINHCVSKPKNPLRFVCCPISGEPEWYWEKD